MAFKACIIVLFLTLVNYVYSYNIRIEIKNSPDIMIYLGSHRGPDFFVVDSTNLINNKAEFKSVANLKTGIYFIVIPPHSRFDILIDKDQDISIKTDFTDLLGKLEITSSDNQYDLFAKLQKEIAQINLQRTQLNMELEFYKTYLKDTIPFIKAKLDSLSISQNNIYKNYKRHLSDSDFLFKLLSLIESFEVPANIQQLQYSDAKAHYQYYVDHYLDRVDFNDESLLNTPEFAFHKLLSDYCYYFFDTRIANPEEVFPDIDNLIQKTSKNLEFNQYVLSYLISRYDNPKDLRLEHYLVHIYRNYFMITPPEWITEQAYKILSNRIESIQHNILGNIAPNLKLKDSENNYYSIHEVDTEYKVLIFWEPDCDICSESVLVLAGNYQNLLNENIQVVAVYIGDDKNEWIDFISENDLYWINLYDPDKKSNLEKYYGTYKTPRIYILDRDNKILTKDIKPESIENYINTHKARIQSEKNRMNIIFGQ